MAKSKPAAPAAPPVRRVKVRATRMGYYGEKRRRAGDTFVMAIGEGKDLPSWVEPAPARAAEVETGAQEALNQELQRVRVDKSAAGDDESEGEESL